MKKMNKAYMIEFSYHALRGNAVRDAPRRRLDAVWEVRDAFTSGCHIVYAFRLAPTYVEAELEGVGIVELCSCRSISSPFRFSVNRRRSLTGIRY
jgi:hypothetical protein